MSIFTSDGSLTNTQTLCGNALDGDTVQLPVSGGPFTWNGSLSITKGITFGLNARTVVRGTGTQPLVNVTNSAAAAFRMTDGVLQQAVASAFLFNIDGAFTNQRFRVDNITATGDPNTGSALLFQFGKAWGLVDHCALSAPTNSEMIHNVSNGPDPAGNDTIGWKDDVSTGSIDAVYIEDSSFTNNDPALLTANPAYFFGNSAIQGYYGARTVFRHNTLFMSQVDMHGGTTLAGARLWEVYENTWTVVANGNQDRYVAMRHGSGVVWNNHKVGASNLGLGEVDFAVEGDTTVYHVGLGKIVSGSPTVDPAYVWNNDASMNVTLGPEVTLNLHLFKSAKPGYTPLVYPHPQQGQSPFRLGFRLHTV